MPWSVRIGIGLILMGWAGRAAIQHWMDTRILHPVDMLVSLAPGHVHTGPFRLNLYADYKVDLDPGTDWHWDTAHPECDPYQHLQTRWVLYRDGKVVDRLDQPTVLPWPSSFTAGPGVYDLDLEVMSDFSCLDPAHRRLRVIATTDVYESLAFAARLTLAIGIYVGFALLIFGPIVRFAHCLDRSDKITESASVGQDFRWAQRLPLRRPISGLPAFGLFGGMVFGVLAVLVMLLTAGFQVTSTGSWVHLLKPGQVWEKSDSWNAPLIVKVKDTGPNQTPKLFVNSKEVSWEDLDRVLKQELGRRPDWVVYVTGDDAPSFQSVANVIDAARGLHAKVYLITEK